MSEEKIQISVPDEQSLTDKFVSLQSSHKAIDKDDSHQLYKRPITNEGPYEVTAHFFMCSIEKSQTLGTHIDAETLNNSTVEFLDDDGNRRTARYYEIELAQ